VASAELIEDVAVHGSRIVVKAGRAFRKRYLAEDFFVEYDADIPLSTLGESILVIPFLLNVMPLVWRSGRSYRIPGLDGDFTASLEDIRQAFRTVYPRVPWDGELVPGRTTPRAASRGLANAALLFSGGVDSAYSSLAQRDVVRSHITVQSLLGRWSWRNERSQTAIQEYFRGYAARLGCESRLITSNLRTFISEARLVGLWPDPRRWMIEVQHGLGFLGLCAPLTESLPIGQLLLASCERDHYGLPGGSHPDIVSAVRWAGVEVRLDGVERTRQEKLRAIAAWLDNGHPPFELRPCLRPAEGFRNCGVCEKCLQTILGLAGEGSDPLRFGFTTTVPQALSTLREQVLGNQLPMPDSGELLQWQDIQRAIRERCVEGVGVGLSEPDEAVDLAWFAGLDLGRYFRRCQRGPRYAVRVVRRRLGLFVDRWPSLGRGVRRVLRRR